MLQKNKTYFVRRPCCSTCSGESFTCWSVLAVCSCAATA